MDIYSSWHTKLLASPASWVRKSSLYIQIRMPDYYHYYYSVVVVVAVVVLTAMMELTTKSAVEMIMPMETDVDGSVGQLATMNANDAY